MNNYLEVENSIQGYSRSSPPTIKYEIIVPETLGESWIGIDMYNPRMYTKYNNTRDGCDTTKTYGVMLLYTKNHNLLFKAYP